MKNRDLVVKMSKCEEQPDLVSTVIPCYNAEEYVGEAIESALSQTYEPMEVIVVDDGSTDDSLEVIKSFDDCITKWKTGPNRGPCAARNTGWRAAKGEFVKFLDADDVIDADIVGKQISYARSNRLGPNSIVYSRVAPMEPQMDIGCMEADYAPPREEEDHVLHALEHNIQTSALLHRRQLLEKIGGFDEDINREDEYDLHVRLMANPDVRFCFMDEVAAYIRDHDGADRITNMDISNKKPLAAYNRVQKRVGNIKRLTGQPLSGPVRRHCAREMWKWGRQVLRHDHPGAATKYFSAARDLDARQCVVGPLPYRFVVRLAGPIRAEQLSEKIKKTRVWSSKEEIKGYYQNLRSRATKTLLKGNNQR